MNTGRDLIAYVVPHTHWDREWYQPLEAFRARLVDVVDAALALLEDPSRDYRRFTLDGQAVVLDDYLAVRPERRGAIEAQVRAGRLRIGPWYVLADEYLVSPESLVRNLRLGLRTCAPFGGTMPVAYTPDSFGHVAQLPLLVAGFGLKAVVFERGVGDEGERLGTEFRWEAADGATDVLAFHLIGTYSAATALGHRDWEYRDAYDPDRAIGQMRAALFGPEAGAADFPTWLREALERLPAGVAGYTRSGHALLLNGSDHLFPQTNLPEVLATLESAIPNVRFLHADVEEFVDAERAGGGELERYRGEFRGSRYHHVLSGVWSTRMPLKQANHASETLLERVAEPLLAAARATTGHDDRPLLDHAWRSLLLNHPHDSICGCSIDAVHRAMHTRFEAVGHLGDELARRAVAALTADAREPQFAVYDPLPEAAWRVVRADLELPAGTGDRVELLDEDGRPLPIQREVVRAFAAGRSDAPVDRVALAFGLHTRPLGLARVTWRTADASAAAGTADAEATDAVEARRTDGGWWLENRALRVHVADDGSVTLFDRLAADGSAGRALRLRLVSEGDAGDEYDFSPVPDDPPRIAERAATAPKLVAPGPLRASIAFDLGLELPERLGDDRRTREGRTTLAARLTLALEAYAEHVELGVAFDHHVADHRLRLVVATGVHADEVASDGHWHVLRRPTNPRAGDAWYQKPVATVHQRRFSAVSDGERGLAVLVRGLPEVEAIPTDAGVDLAVTLLRAVGWLSRDDLTTRPQGAGPAVATPEAQCPGPQRFELALCPFDGDVDAVRLHRAAERFVAPPRAFRAGPIDPRPDLAPPTEADAGPAGGADPSEPWRLQLTAPLTLSAVVPADAPGRTLVRFWNPTTRRVRGHLALTPTPTAAHRVRLDATRLAAMPIDGSGVALDVGPSEVVTLELDHGRTDSAHRSEGGGGMT
ncbi:MAG: glycoside hydrolase family 38 C-terminal domain-containing protein [Trueperaceae bacterium]